MTMAPSRYASNVAPTPTPQSAMRDFDCQPHLRGEPLPVAFGISKEDDLEFKLCNPKEVDLEFKLWVETDIDVAWCLPGDECGANQAAASDAMWRQNCTTSTMRRTWENFELLDKPSKHVCDIALQEAMGKLRESCLSIQAFVIDMPPRQSDDSLQDTVHGAFQCHRLSIPCCTVGACRQ